MILRCKSLHHSETQRLLFMTLLWTQSSPYFLFFHSAIHHITVKLNAVRMLFQVVLSKGKSECMKEKQSKGRRKWKSPTGNINHFICITTSCSPVAEQDDSCWISTAPEPFDWSRSTDWRPLSVCLSARLIRMCTHKRFCNLFVWLNN